MEPLPYPCALREEILSQPDPVDTVPKMWDFAVNKRRGQVACGTREVLAEETELQPDGKTFTKLIQVRKPKRNSRQRD